MPSGFLGEGSSAETVPSQRWLLEEFPKHIKNFKNAKLAKKELGVPQNKNAENRNYVPKNTNKSTEKRKKEKMRPKLQNGKNAKKGHGTLVSIEWTMVSKEPYLIHFTKFNFP